MSKENMIKRDIQKDIEKIKEGTQNNIEIENLKKLHMHIDGKYQSKIENWGLSQYGWIDNYGFSYEYLDEETIKHNLLNMQSKLEGYLQDYRLIPNTSLSTDIKVINNNTNSNNINIKIDFQSLIKQIDEMESLTENETKEAISKIKEIETIYNSKESKKKKWEKIKGILIWLADKSVDLAIAYLPIITNSLK